MLINLLFGNSSFLNIILYLVSCVIIIFCVTPVHEFAHAFTAYKLGDPTPKYQGRLTLNPFAHINYRGALMILIFGFGWANPVRINPRYFDDRKWGMALTAIAGPASNILMALVVSFFTALIIAFAPTTITTYIICVIFNYIAQINLNLALFNLVPIPPLDGSRILNVVLPERIYFMIMQYEHYSFILVLFLSFIGVFDWLNNLSAVVLQLFMSVFMNIFL